MGLPVNLKIILLGLTYHVFPQKTSPLGSFSTNGLLHEFGQLYINQVQRPNKTLTRIGLTISLNCIKYN